MNLKDEMSNRIKAAFDDAEIFLADYTGGGDHWEATIVSSAFEGMSRVQKHRSVYAALGELMHGPIHALTFRTLTPEQYELETS
ncbi:MAG: BolA family protein [Myxococcota bacterium]|nr:BolA family protein [Myxococcota bacterium]